MTRFRVSRPAQADLETILAVSRERWEDDGQARYSALLEAAFRAIAAKPRGPTTRERSALLPGIRSFHLRHARTARAVQDPVHMVFYRIADDGSIEIIRVLHERMDPALHLERAVRRPVRRATRRRGR